MKLNPGQLDVIRYLENKPNGVTIKDMVNDIPSAQHIGNNSYQYQYDRVSRMVKRNLVTKVKTGIYILGEEGKKYLIAEQSDNKQLD